MHHIVHGSLECGWHVLEELEVVVMYSEGHLVDVALVLGEELGAVQFVKELVDHWDGEHVILEFKVVDAASGTIMLHEEDRGHEG